MSNDDPKWPPQQGGYGFDPMTGQPLGPPAQRFDPMTGQPIQAQPQPPAQGFDPMTGRPLGQPPQAPQYQQPPQQPWQQPPQQQWQQPQQPPQQQWQQPPQQQQWQQPPAQPQYPPPAYPSGPPPLTGDPEPSGSLRQEANATVGVSDRVRFIRMTYLHLMGAILVFAGLLYLLMTNIWLITHVSAPLVTFALGGRFNWAVVLGVFMVVSWVADYWASHTTSKGMQYVGLGLYTVAEALIFVPLLVIVEFKTQAILAKGGHEPHIIRDSAFTTLGIFAALTASVLFTKKDFSFLRSGLAIASGGAMMLVVLSLVFGFNLGIIFSVAMVLLCAGYILFQTSQVLAHYNTENYVAASLALFSSIALMFWYVIRIFMRMRE